MQPAAVTTSHTLTMPAAQGAASTYLKNNGSGALSWETAGDASGPASATDNAVARFDLTTGKLLQNSGVTISDTADVAGAKTLAMSGATSGVLTVRPAATTTSHTLTLPAVQGAVSSVLQNDGTGALSWAILAASSAPIKGLQTFGTAGTFTYTPSAAATRALVYVTGGGGGGAGVATGVNNSVGSGGNGGASFVGLYVVSSATTGTVTVGSGGNGGSAAAGSAGGASTFLYPATGSPNGTITGGGGAGGAVKSNSQDEHFANPNNSRAAGTSTGFNSVLLGGFAIAGQYGGPGIGVVADTVMGGSGGNGLYGGGANSVAINNSNVRTNGNAAFNGTGGGGGGACQTNNSQTGTGGAGGDGRVVIFEY
jgi:hypothetical protein